MKFNIFRWCDERLTQLKDSGIEIRDGVAFMPETMIYSGEVKCISTYKYRNDIPAEHRENSLLCNFMPDSDLFVRLAKLEEDYEEIKAYGGICGQDISPSIGMLRPRQQFSILINSIYNCCVGLRGTKILPNSRVGDLKTMSMIHSFPSGVSFIAGLHGCKNYGFKDYGLYQLRLLLVS